MEMYDILHCVDRALDTFGSNAKQSVYWNFTSKEGISSDSILSKPQAFVNTIREVFGPNGSKLVERAVVREIKSAFNLQGTISSYTIFEALEIASKGIAGDSQLSSAFITG
jgi:hypothetical protein